MSAPAGTTVDGPVSLAIFWYGASTPGPQTSATAGASDGGGNADPPLHCGGTVTPSRQSTSLAWSPFVSQSVRYDAAFPINFSIPVTTVPPKDAQEDLSASGGTGFLSLGMVVAYRDLDGDGAYGFGGPDREPEPILATSLVNGGPSSWVLFLDGHGGSSDALPGGAGAGQGFSVLSSEAGASAGPQLHPASTPIALAVSGAAATPLYGCKTRTLTSVVGQAEPAGAVRTCLSPDGYTWEARRSTGTCAEELSVGITCQSAPHAADWPCP